MEDSVFLRYDATSLGKWYSGFQKNVLSLSSKDSRPSFTDLENMKTKETQPCDMSRTTYQVTQHHLPENHNPQLQPCKNL
jgi:hypothetical protein